MKRKLDSPESGLAEGLRKIAALRDGGRLRDAVRIGEQLLQTRPRTKPLLNQLGAILLELEEWERAADRLRQSVQLDPRQPLVSARLGHAFLKLGKPREALAAQAHALALNPGLVEAHVGNAQALAASGQAEQAIVALEDAARRFPGAVEMHHQRAKLLRKLGRFDEADAEFGEALRLRPGFVPTLVLRSLMLAERGDIDSATSYGRQAVAAAPLQASPKAVLGEVLLLAGCYAEAWELCESRREHGRNRRHTLDHEGIPIWDGHASIAGKSVLIQPELGLGDYVMFSRYVPLVRERGGHPVLLAPVPLASLLQSLEGSPTVISRGSPLPAVDYRCPVMSLPRAFGTTLETIPGRFPYLRADPAKVAQWETRLGPRTRPRIGIVWSGKESRGIDQILQRRRTIDVRSLAPLWSLPLEFHSLQKEVSPADAEWLAQQACVRDHMAALADFSDTAALASHMDLVLSIDTSVAHVVGALALPLWVMLPYFSDYRWNPQLPTSPWYPDARLFRQPSPGNWDVVAGSVAAALHERFLR